MAVQSDTVRWKKWAECLRQEMMVGLTPEITKSIDVIATETGTSKAKKTLQSLAFWRSGKSGASTFDSLSAAGFEIEVEADADSKVSEVTLKLNQTWLSIMQRVLDRAKR